MKDIIHIKRNVSLHWVGDGFPVRSLFTYHTLDGALDPFLLLDYAGPHEFDPSQQRRGVGEHPHRGFETVTIVYQGELEHRDSAGNQGKIGPGDVQWMTAASGVVHEEFHSTAFTASGGTFEVVQLWVNLPGRLKMSPPQYQEILHTQIPEIALAHGAGKARIIAGELNGIRGPAKTFTPIQLWDLRLSAGGHVELPLADGHTSALVVQQGTVTINDVETVRGVEAAVFDWRGERIKIASTSGATALLLAGEPIGEPVVGQGPFVMNTRQEIEQAVRDFQEGRMGSLL